MSASNFSEKSPRILVIRAGAIGDTLMATPLLRAIRQTYPNAYLGAICSDTAFDVLRYNPHLDEVFPIAHRHLPNWLSLEKRRIARHFRSLRLDTILSLEANPEFTNLASRISAKRIFTYSRSDVGGNIALLEWDVNEHSIESHLRAGKSIGTKSAGIDMEFHYPAGIDDALRQKLRENEIGESDLVIGIHAGWGSRRQHPTDTRLRSWPAERFSEVARWLRENFNAKIVLTGSVTDRPLNKFIAGSAGVDCLNLAGRLSLIESAALIRRMDLYITIDSGPAHLAAALGTPLITLWGPGIFTATAPMSEKSPVEIIRSPPACAPCYGTNYMKSCTDNICMKRIGVNDLKVAVESMLAKSKS